MAAVWGCTKDEAVAATDHEAPSGWRIGGYIHKEQEREGQEARDCTILATQEAKDEQSRVELE